MVPNNYPPIANQWINQYNSTTGNFGGSRPLLANIGDWPSPTGQNGKVLSTNGATYSWVTQAGGGGAVGEDAINVKDTGLGSGDAVGDGTTDDTAAIQGALNAAAANGLTVYFPSGRYRLTHGLAPTAGRVSLIGDSGWSSILQIDVGALPAGPILDLSNNLGSLVSRLGFDGRVGTATTGTIPLRHGVWARGANTITSSNVFYTGFLGLGSVLIFVTTA
jgi:hypothetical protein